MSSKIRFIMKDGTDWINMCNLPKEIGNLFRGLRNQGIRPAVGDVIYFDHSQAYKVKTVTHSIDYDPQGEFLVTDIIVEKTNVAHLV